MKLELFMYAVYPLPGRSGCWLNRSPSPHSHRGQQQQTRRPHKPLPKPWHCVTPLRRKKCTGVRPPTVEPAHRLGSTPAGNHNWLRRAKMGNHDREGGETNHEEKTCSPFFYAKSATKRPLMTCCSFCCGMVFFLVVSALRRSV